MMPGEAFAKKVYPNQTAPAGLSNQGMLYFKIICLCNDPRVNIFPFVKTKYASSIIDFKVSANTYS